MRTVLALGVVLVLFAAPAFVGAGEDTPGQLKVGFGQSDITPPVGATMAGAGLVRNVGTDDPLMARTLAAQSGDRDQGRGSLSRQPHQPRALAGRSAHGGLCRTRLVRLD